MRIAVVAIVALSAAPAWAGNTDWSACWTAEPSIEACTRFIANSDVRADRAKAFFARGVTLAAKGETDRAIADLNEAIRLGPKYARAYYERGVALSKKSETDRAIADYTEAIRLDPKYAVAYYERGVALYKKGETDRAIADYNEAIRLDPKYAFAYNARGAAHYRNGEIDRAIADLNEAIRLDPKDAYARKNRGVVLSYAGETDRAIADFSEAIRLNLKFIDAYNGRGIALRDKGETDSAIADFGQAIRLDPKFAVAYYERGLALSNRGETDRAIADYNEAIRLDPKYARAYNNRGLALSDKGETDRAIADYDEAIRLDPKYAYAYRNRAEIRVRAKQFDSAMTDIDKALEFAGETRPAAKAYALRAYVRELRGDVAGADRDIAKSFEIAVAAKDPDALAPPLLYRGEIRLMRGDAKGALADFEAALAKDPANRFAREGRDAATRALATVAAAAPVSPAAPAKPPLAAALPATHNVQRLALVVGINAYPNLRTPRDPTHLQLVKAIPDARAMQATLAGLGYDVDLVTDPDQGRLLAAIDRLKARAKAGATVFVFYAGHGVAIRGTNYLLPSDIPALDPQSESLIAKRAVAETDILDALREKDVGLVVLALDACRNNPIEDFARAQAAAQGRVFASRSTSMRAVGLETRPASGVFAIYSAGFGQTALDSAPGSGENSVFTSIFAKKLSDRGRHLADIMEDVKEEVAKTAASVIDADTGKPHRQSPAYYNETQGGRIFLAGAPAQ